MGKEIKSPVKKWPGTVTLYDPLSLPQVVAFQDALQSAKDLAWEDEEDIETLKLAAYHGELFPAVLSCVEKWELEGIADPPDPFPGTPRKASAELMIWLTTGITELFNEDEEKKSE